MLTCHARAPQDAGRHELESKAVLPGSGHEAVLRGQGPGPKGVLLFVASFVALYFEMVVIRYLSTEIRDFAYLQNLPLIASFLGLGAGMIIARPMRMVKRLFPYLAAALFVLIAYAPVLGLTHIPFPGADYFIWKQANDTIPASVAVFEYLGCVLGITALVVAFFLSLGKIVGEYLATMRPLTGYGINLAGSLAGIIAFTWISFSGLPPVSWIALGLLAILPFYYRDRMAIVLFCITILAMSMPQRNSFWSPYYHIELQELTPPAGWSHSSAYFLSANHDYHQKMVDLSPGFVSRFPNAEPNRSALPTYELPYQLLRNPEDVLIVGAGTGNDVAAAIRHGVKHIDAVEVDPVILQIGKKYHPERPYASPTVTTHVNDARAFFKEANQHSYDLVEFAYLDSHTMFTSFSSLRLDNYVYTLESFKEARSLLNRNGILVLAFAGGRSFVTDRLFVTMTQAFGKTPSVYEMGYDNSGEVLVETQGDRSVAALPFPEISAQLDRGKTETVATDDWPFLYLKDRGIPLSILVVLIPFLVGAYILLRDTQSLPSLLNSRSQHLFLLGAGFLLLETKGVTQLSLLFGSTWIVNAVVIASFLVMALIANTLILLVPISRRLSYPALFVFLAVGLFFPYGRLNALPSVEKVIVAGLLVGIPVFFSGLVFSRSFQEALKPSEALGVNLLGAVVGGALENTVTIGGTALLGYLALVIYGFSLLALLWGARAALEAFTSVAPAE